MSAENIIRQVASDGVSTVTLRGALNIETSAELHHALLESLNESQRVVLDARQLEGIDITCLQVICSACKTATTEKRSFECEGKIPECLDALRGSIGAGQKGSCNQNPHEACIRFGGGK